MDMNYSHRSLLEKLGIKENSRIILLNPPLAYPISHTIIPSSIFEEKLEGQFDFIHFFAQDKLDLERIFPKLKQSLKKDGALWISWKKGSRMPGSLNENKVQELGLQNGLVDVKVISVDDVWSGLKFVFRTKDRD
jgi:hypothetical protein